MSNNETYIWFEPTARDVAEANFRRFGKWLLSDELTEDQKSERLREVFAHTAHDGIILGYELAKLTIGELDNQSNDPEALLIAEHKGYINAIKDIDEGQGEK